MSEASTPDSQFAPVPLSKIMPEEALCADIYIKIGEKYIKFKGVGDEIAADKYNIFIAKHIKTLYIPMNHVKQFMEWLKQSEEEEIDRAVLDIGEEYREIVVQRQELKDQVFQTFADEEVSTATVKVLQGLVSTFVENVSQQKIPAELLARLAGQNNNIAEHSVNVADLSVFIAMILGEGHQLILENVYMGGLFHDYGKAKISAKLLEQPASPQYSQAIQMHPASGVRMLSKIEDIQEAVLTMVAQHHEQYNGKGYPANLKGNKIYKLAQVISIANTYDNALIDNRGKADAYKIAIKVIEYDKGKMFNPEYMPRVIDALKLAFGNYHRERKEKK